MLKESASQTGVLSKRLSAVLRLTATAVMSIGVLQSPPLQANFPSCQAQYSDSDGDGWGWENNTSCQVVAILADKTDIGTCKNGNSDLDGDGWGWENNASCVVVKTKTSTPKNISTNFNEIGFASCTNTNSDADGDGWGWENGRSCATVAKKTSDKNYQSSDITNLILVTGQSNTLGAGTSVDYQLDGPHPRVFAYTTNGWQVAELHQTWDQGKFPGNGDRYASSDTITNNLALHFGKRLAQLNANAVVGFVLVSEPGEGIENWNPGNNGMNRVQQKVTAAINELPHKSAIDGILWHQGETDWLEEGTADVDVPKPAPTDYYPVKLAQLINNLRLENWYDNQTPFICGETNAATGVNIHLNALNTDNDPQTACVAGFGLPARDISRTHFDAEGLRIIGQRYADAYNDMAKN